MAAADATQYPYLDTIDLATLVHTNIYTKEIYRLSENDRYGLTRSKCTYF